MKEKKEEEGKVILQKTENPDCYQYGDYIVELEFSLDGPTFSEIIRQYINRKLES